MKTRLGREPPGARIWRAVRIRARIPAARDVRDASAEQEDADHAVAALYQLNYAHWSGSRRCRGETWRRRKTAVQDAFAAVHGRWHVLSDADAALAYLRWSVVHRARSAPPFGPTAGTGEPGSAVVSASRALPARQREVVVLRYFADLPEAEIASATGMSMAAVRDHTARAMSSLQAGLGE